MSAVGKFFKNVGQKVWNGIKTVGQTVWGGIKSVGKGIGSVFRGDFKGALEHGKNALATGAKMGTTIGRAAFDTIGLGGVHDKITGFADKMKKPLADAYGMGGVLDIMDKIENKNRGGNNSPSQGGGYRQPSYGGYRDSQSGYGMSIPPHRRMPYGGGYGY